MADLKPGRLTESPSIKQNFGLNKKLVKDEKKLVRASRNEKGVSCCTSLSRPLVVTQSNDKNNPLPHNGLLKYSTSGPFLQPKRSLTQMNTEGMRSADMLSDAEADQKQEDNINVDTDRKNLVQRVSQQAK